jgi:[methyl-Co(III) methanol-specific corrinoid protein]:coenzyme M methyltransferase
MRGLMMSEMSPYERVMAAYKGEDFDCFPALTPTSIVTRELMRGANAYFPSAHLNQIDTFNLSEAGYTQLGFDSISPYFSIHLEAEALGCTVDWQDKYGMPQVIKKPLKNIENYSLPNNYIDNKQFSTFISIITKLNKKYNKKVPIIGKVVGPWTLAYHLFGVDNLILKTIIEPDLIKAFIREISKCPIEFAKRQFEAGADFVVWADHVTEDLVSPQIYKEFVLPIHQEAVEELKSYGPLILHVCGNLQDRIPEISKSKMQMLHIDSRNDFKSSSQKVSGEMRLVGFLNNPYLLRKGTVLEVHNETMRLLKEGVTFVAPECAIPFAVPNNNLIELSKTLHANNRSIINKIS